MQYIFLDTSFKSFKFCNLCEDAFYYISAQISTSISFHSDLPSVLNVSKSFDFIACEKDVLWLLSSSLLRIAELRHILRFCICKFRFYVLCSSLQLFKSEHLEFHLVCGVKVVCGSEDACLCRTLRDILLDHNSCVRLRYDIAQLKSINMLLIMQLLCNAISKLNIF